MLLKPLTIKMNGRIRLLLILPFAPRLDADHGGGRLVGQFLWEVTKRCGVAVLYLRSPGEPPIDESLRDRCDLSEEVLRKPVGRSFFSRLGHGFRLLASLAQGNPMWTSDWYSPAFLHRTRSLVREYQPDIVQAEYHIMGQYLLGLDGWEVPRVLVEHEPGTRAAPYLQNAPLAFTKAVHRLEHRHWSRYEAAVFHQVNAVVAFTEADRQEIRKTSPAAQAYVIPPGTVIPEAPLNPLGEQPPSLLFTGNFIHPPNVEAASRLVRRIFPLLQKITPELQVTIVGSHPPADLVKLAGGKITITGWVPDVLPYLERASLIVAPMISGGGIRVKVIEALAAGKAVVATPLAIEGLPLRDGIHVSIAEQDEELARCILELLGDPEKRKTLGTNGRHWVCDHLSWPETVDQYLSLYSSLQ
jgi:polysaccharide biosynthesis protein PslH